jgi:hypothetical protein
MRNKLSHKCLKQAANPSDTFKNKALRQSNPPQNVSQSAYFDQFKVKNGVAPS